MTELGIQEMSSLRGGDGSGSWPWPANIAIGSFNGGNVIVAPTVQIDPALAVGVGSAGAVTAIAQNIQEGAQITIA